MTFFPQFTSYVAAVSAVITENSLNAYVGKFEEAYDCELDTILTTPGVTIKYLEQPHEGASRQTYMRQGTTLNFASGFADVSYAYEGRTMTWHATRWVTQGQLYVLKLQGSNIKRYVPPALPQAGSKSGFAQEVEFIGPAIGYNGIFVPVQDSSANIIRMVQAPFDMLYQIAPDDVRSIKLTSITEAW